MARERVVVVGDSPLVERAEALLRHVEARERDGGEFMRIEGGGSAEYYVKGGPLRRRSARRHGFARLLLRRPPPRLREYRNLVLLRARAFSTPEPILAAARVRGASVLSQVLVTARVPDAAGYEALLSSPHAPDRRLALATLADTLARFHSVGFEHGDLYARNLLYSRTHDGARVVPVILDMWRRSPVPSWRRKRTLLRRASHDLGLLCTDLAPTTSPAEQRAFLRRYLRRLDELGDELVPFLFAHEVEEAYRREVRRLTEHPERRRGRPLPPPGWTVPELDGADGGRVNS
ncbi:MAG: lipopolysaccharide kinase InaA family protein [Planctomycetota bacterium]